MRREEKNTKIVVKKQRSESANEVLQTEEQKTHDFRGKFDEAKSAVLARELISRNKHID
jgi:hypothetical protein